MRFIAYRRLSRLLRPASSISPIPGIAAGWKPKNRFRSPADTGDLTTFRKILWSIDLAVAGLSHVPSTARLDVSLFYRPVSKFFSALRPVYYTGRRIPITQTSGRVHVSLNKISFRCFPFSAGYKVHSRTRRRVFSLTPPSIRRLLPPFCALFYELYI